MSTLTEESATLKDSLARVQNHINEANELRKNYDAGLLPLNDLKQQLHDAAKTITFELTTIGLSKHTRQYPIKKDGPLFTELSDSQTMYYTVGYVDKIKVVDVLCSTSPDTYSVKNFKGNTNSNYTGLRVAQVPEKLKKFSEEYFRNQFSDNAKKFMNNGE